MVSPNVVVTALMTQCQVKPKLRKRRCKFAAAAAVDLLTYIQSWILTVCVVATCSALRSTHTHPSKGQARVHATWGSTRMDTIKSDLWLPNDIF